MIEFEVSDGRFKDGETPFVPRLRCDYCGRFCGPDRLFADEFGEAGVVRSWIAVCPRCEERHYKKGY